jgi:hypothetical protein
MDIPDRPVTFCSLSLVVHTELKKLSVTFNNHSTTHSQLPFTYSLITSVHPFIKLTRIIFISLLCSIHLNHLVFFPFFKMKFANPKDRPSKGSETTPQKASTPFKPRTNVKEGSSEIITDVVPVTTVPSPIPTKSITKFSTTKRGKPLAVGKTSSPSVSVPEPFKIAKTIEPKVVT